MYVRPWWVELLKWLLAGGLLYVLGRWLNADRLRRPVRAGTLPYPPRTVALASVCLLLIGGLFASCLFWPDESVTWWVTTAAGFFAILSLHWWLDCVVARFEFDAEALVGRSPLGLPRRLCWAELRRVRYSTWFKWFRLEAADGQCARISMQRMGLPEFAEHLLQHAPAVAIDAATRDLLRDTADGMPPLV